MRSRPCSRAARRLRAISSRKASRRCRSPACCGRTGFGLKWCVPADLRAELHVEDRKMPSHAEPSSADPADAPDALVFVREAGQRAEAERSIALWLGEIV